MKRKRFAAVATFVVIVLSVSATTCYVLGQGHPDDPQFAGAWQGTYTSETGDTEKLSYVLSKDDKGHWRGSMKYTNQEGDHAAEFKLLEIDGNKFKGKIDMHEGAFEVTLEGEQKGDELSGVYLVRPKDPDQPAEIGIWKLTRVVAAKPAQ